MNDEPEILDAARLAGMGHSEDEVRWFLQYATRGSASRPYLDRAEYERLLAEWQREGDQ